MHLIQRLLVVLVALAALIGAPGPGRADALDDYRASGVIAERFDGFIEIRDAGAPGDARALVETVNAKRRAIYDQRARESNVPASEVGKVFAKQIVEKAPKGTYVRRSDGSYARK